MPNLEHYKDNFERMYESSFEISPPDVRPLLAHYTTIETLEKILKSKEIWLSNPLFMNDLEEVRFVLNTCSEHVSKADLTARCGDSKKAERFKSAYFEYFTTYDQNYLLDIYILCLSEHQETDTDGLLSMWRGYGGRGDGAAIVFFTKGLPEVVDSPLSLEKVQYQTQEQREAWVLDKINIFSEMIGIEDIPEDMIYLSAYFLFQTVLKYALLTKHMGFSEEKEWRVIYWPDRGHSAFKDGLTYIVRPTGVQPKLKIPFKSIPNVTVPENSPNVRFELAILVERIIIGPTLSSPLLSSSIKRMIEILDPGGDLKNRVVASSIPYRNI